MKQLIKVKVIKGMLKNVQGVLRKVGTKLRTVALQEWVCTPLM